MIIGGVIILCKREGLSYMLREKFELITWAIEVIITKLKNQLNVVE